MALNGSPEAQKGGQVSPLLSHPAVGKQIVAVAHGADIGGMYLFLWNTGFPENDLIGLPQIQLVFARFSVEAKEILPMCFVKGSLKLLRHLLTHFKAFPADAGALSLIHI